MTSFSEDGAPKQSMGPVATSLTPSLLALGRSSIPALSGISAGIFTALACSPLDVAKIRIVVQDTIPGQRRRYTGTLRTLLMILKEEGIRGWYKGITPALVSIPLFWGVFFTTYDAAKNSLRIWTGEEQHVLAAVTAGGFTDVVTNPWWVVRTRMQTQILHAERGLKETNMLQTFRSIIKEEGFLSLYRGLSASFLGLTHIAIQLPVYEKLKVMARERNGGGPERAVDLVAASIVSKVSGSLLSYPHEVLRARMQDERGGRRGVFDMGRQMVKQEGLPSLYVGFRINLARVVPSCVATFLSYELVARELRKCLHVPEPQLPAKVIVSRRSASGRDNSRNGSSSGT